MGARSKAMPKCESLTSAKAACLRVRVEELRPVVQDRIDSFDVAPVRLQPNVDVLWLSRNRHAVVAGLDNLRRPIAVREYADYLSCAENGRPQVLLRGG